ncbi:MAG: plasmid stabilization protein, partial [Bacteroidales bacterium]|nr:plasmid stabilization protein [Bacteroidales bacterium]
MSFDLKVIKNANDHKEAKEKIKELLGQDLDYDSKDYKLMQVLAVLVENYEKKTVDLGVLDPIEAIKHRMREKGLKQRDLVPYIGSPEAVSEVLNRKRNFTFEMIKVFNEILDIPLD